MGRSVARKASFGLDVLWRAEACLLREHADTTDEMKRHDERQQQGGRREKYLESLLDLFHEHIAVGSETIDCKYSPVSPERNASARYESIARCMAYNLKTLGA